MSAAGFTDYANRRARRFSRCHFSGCDEEANGMVQVRLEEKIAGGRGQRRVHGSDARGLCEAHAVEVYGALLDLFDQKVLR